MTQNEILEKLREVMKQTSEADVDWDSIEGESTIDSLGFDSLSILDLIYDIQQEFGVDFDAEAMTDVRTVQELVSFLEAQGA